MIIRYLNPWGKGFWSLWVRISDPESREFANTWQAKRFQ